MKRKPVTAAMVTQWFLTELAKPNVPATGMIGVFVRCATCKEPIEPDQAVQWDHTHALVHSGPHDYSNLRPLHVACHKLKTARDIKDNAKVKRLAKGPRKSKNPLPGSRSSRWKKRMDGAVERRS